MGLKKINRIRWDDNSVMSVAGTQKLSKSVARVCCYQAFRSECGESIYYLNEGETFHRQT